MAKKKDRHNTDKIISGPKKESWKFSVMIKKIIKIIFFWIPVSLVLFIIVFLIAISLYLSPGRVENLITADFNDMSYGKISLKVKKFSLYSGFEISNIIIRNGDEFNRTKFIEIDRLALRYNLFPMLIGNIYFKEIGIYKPRIYLKQKNGVWNAARLMKPDKEKQEKKEISEEKETASNEISLPVSVKLLLNLVLDDLRIYINGDSFNSSVEGLTYNLDLFMPPFKKIPKSPKAILLFKSMKMELNPRGSVDISFSNKEAGVETPLIFTWKFVFDRSEKSREFESVLKLGAQNAPVRYKNIFLAPLNFMISYDILYNPANDHLKINSLSVMFKNNKWLNLEGDIDRISTKQEFNIRMTESKIVLSDLYPYFLSFTGDRSTKFSGIISLSPIVITGNPSDNNIEGRLNLTDIYFKNPEIETAIPEIKLSYSFKKKSDYIKLSAGLNSRSISANIGRDKLGNNGIGLELDLSAYNDFQKIDIHNFLFKVFNPDSKWPALDIALNGDVNLKHLSGNINITGFTFQKENLSDGIKNKYLSSVQLKKPIDLSLGLKFALSGSKTTADLGMLVKAPDYNIDDLRINADITQDNKEKRIWLNKLGVESRAAGLKIGAIGRIDTAVPPFSDSDLSITAELDSPQMKPIYGPWNLSGRFKLTFNMKGDIKTGKTSGSIKINNLFVNNKESLLSIEDLNMDFPFEYHFASGIVESRIAVDKIQLFDNENFKEKENFTIRSVKAKHPARKIEFEYARDFAATMFFRNNAFEITKMKMYVLDGAVYGRDILFYLADMPATRNFKNVEYRLVLDAANVDIGKLDNPDRKGRSEAELSLNAHFSGKGLDMFLGKGKDRGKELNTKGFININKIGEKFAKKLFEGLNEEKGKSKIGIAQYVLDNTMNIKGFNYNLDIGLMNVEVALSRRAIGYLILVEDIRITRMPIQEYLNNIFGRNQNEDI